MPDEPLPPMTFSAFVLSLATSAAMHFGDLDEGETGTPAEANLPAARQMIDILALLQEKTRGNLTPDEGELLEQVLYELRLRFVQKQEPQKRIILP